MRRFFYVSLIILTAILSLIINKDAAQAFEYKKINPSYAMEVKAGGAILIEQRTGKILYEKNAYEKLYPASTTKILTALLAIENGDMNEIVTVGNEIALARADGSSAGLVQGEKMKLSELITALMLPSGNDAAYTIAVYAARLVSGDKDMNNADAVKYFVKMMNDRAKKIGAVYSNFINPHGYHDKNHYSTAYDLSLIAREAMKYDFFRNVVKTHSYTFEESPAGNLKTATKGVQLWTNTNELINVKGKYFYYYATGIKTGHTTPAGYCLVSSASLNGMDVICVILNSASEGQVWEDSRKLLSYGLENYVSYTVVSKNQMAYTAEVENSEGSKPVKLNLLADSGCSEVLNKEDIQKIYKRILLDENLITASGEDQNKIRILSSISRGQILGKAQYMLDGRVIKEVGLVSDADLKKRSVINSIPGIQLVTKHRYISAAAGILLLVTCMVFIIPRKGRSRKRRMGI